MRNSSRFCLKNLFLPHFIGVISHFYTSFSQYPMIVQRIKAYIDAKNISISAFEKMVGLANGTFRKSYEGNKAIKSDVLEEVFAIFEDISPIWLLTGEGEMLKPNPSFSNNTIKNSSNAVIGGDNIVHCDSTDKLITELSEQRKMFERIINQKDSIIQKLLADRDKS